MLKRARAYDFAVFFFNVRGRFQRFNIGSEQSYRIWANYE